MGSNAITTIIGEHLLIRNGKSSPSRAITGEYPVYGSNGIIGYSDEYNANENTIIIGRVGSYCGSVYISGKKCWVTDNAIIGTAKNENESHFWFYLLKKIDLNNYSTGSGQPLINQTIINTISVTIPKLSEKRVSIGHFLRHFDQKINLSLNINQSLEQMSQTLFKSWFVDFDPVIDNALDAGNPIPEALQSRAELRQKVRSSADFKPLPAEIRSLFPSEFEETELGWVPKGWSFTALKNFGKIICGKTPTKSNKNYYGEDFLFIKIPDMHGKVFVTNSHDKLSKLGSESQSNKIIPHGSICVSCIATVGLVSINAQDCHTNQQINSIVPNSPHYRNYLYFSMLEKYKIFHDLASGGSATLNMNTSVFSNIATLMPNNLVLKQFHKITEPWFEAILLNEYKLTSLASLRDTLLPKLISGELSLEDLPDLNTDTEAA
ncbi:restriction endonuclease subunit S [Escherichia coli]|uniref:restriction endonuclease subunit S n=1 Tax=Escherichia coli TaxID=562 RepID=UPI001ABBF7A6|nr:restriction endonuclease subunit S [Escherichia coli]